MTTKTRWYKDAFIYQIYPRSYKDSDGDGIGDIRGIIEKLDYLADLGINAVWLSPCYKSPNADNGYDISDYRDIMDDFGTMADWKEMISGMHARGIRLIMDLVVNHSSDRHFWFQESRKSKDNPYRDYYIWRKGRGKNGKKPPNNWTSRFGGSAWKYDELTDEWYLHLFTVNQPDLNWDNPKVRQEVADLVNFWLDLGVDGFRCDVITYISKVEGLPDGKIRSLTTIGDEMFTHGPHIHKYLKELYQRTFKNYNCMTVGEAAGVTVEQGLLYTGEGRDELDTVFQFEQSECDSFMHILPTSFNLRKFKAVFEKWQKGLHNKGWNSLYYENHDQPRSLPRYTGNYGPYRVEAAKMLAVSLYMMQGTPYVYQGQEIGMTSCKFTDLSQFQDVVVQNVKDMLLIKAPFLKGIVLKVLNKVARDHARTPMQWNADNNAGFSTGTPWMMVNPNYTEINVESALNDPQSVYYFYKKLIAYRRDNAILRDGTFTQYYSGSKKLFCYERGLDGQKLLVVCNFTAKSQKFTVPDAFGEIKAIVLKNYDDAPVSKEIVLRPYEAIVYNN